MGKTYRRRPQHMDKRMKGITKSSRKKSEKGYQEYYQDTEDSFFEPEKEGAEKPV